MSSRLLILLLAVANMSLLYSAQGDRIDKDTESLRARRAELSAKLRTHGPEIVNVDSLKTHFENADVVGTFALYDSKTNRMLVHK